jgi:hypothetical protein
MSAYDVVPPLPFAIMVVVTDVLVLVLLTMDVFSDYAYWKSIYISFAMLGYLPSIVFGLYLVVCRNSLESAYFFSCSFGLGYLFYVLPVTSLTWYFKAERSDVIIYFLSFIPLAVFGVVFGLVFKYHDQIKYIKSDN